VIEAGCDNQASNLGLQPSQSPAHGCIVNAVRRKRGRCPNGVEQLELLVLWRGMPGWFLGPGGSRWSGGGSAPYYTWITRIHGDRTLTLTLDYDSTKGFAVVQRRTARVGRQHRRVRG